MANILVVDDDPAARDLLVTVLGFAQHDVGEAEDGLAALAAAHVRRPDLIIADLLMPTMDGFEFVRRLRETTAFASVPVVFYTATYLESEIRELARACGVQHIITKPAEPEQILDIIQRSLGAAPVPALPPSVEEFRSVHLGLLTNKLAQRAGQAVPRLDAMIELGLELASERDPQRLMSQFCTSARKIVGAKYSTVGVLDKHDRRLRYEFASGMSPEITARLTAPPLPVPILETVLSDRVARRLSALPGRPEEVGLPEGHPPVHSFLCAPIASPDRVYGWLCLADKIGSREFSEEDEGLAQILAAQVGRIYENGSLYAEVQRHVRQLEEEVDQRRRAQEEVRALNASLEARVAERTAELEAANRELEAFSFSVSHDLRSPLTAINGFADVLLTFHAQYLPPVVHENLTAIRDAGLRMNRLIDDLLNLSRITRHELQRERVNVSTMAERTIAELRRADIDRNVTVRVAPDLVVMADANLLQIALENLLRNAWKFTSRTPVSEIEVGSEPRGQRTAFFVRDNGAGFDMQYAHRLFGAFQRLHHERDFPGTGIGLAIVNRVVRRHGGEAWAVGQPGAGATFYFTLGNGGA